jgi:hypothetical protein
MMLKQSSCFDNLDFKTAGTVDYYACLIELENLHTVQTHVYRVFRITCIGRDHGRDT